MNRHGTSLTLLALPDFPEVRPQDDLSIFIQEALERIAWRLEPYDVLVVAQKIVSKSEGRFIQLSSLPPSDEAKAIASQSGKDPHKVQAILEESATILRVAHTPPNGTVIARHKQGWVCANAGIDESNLGPQTTDDLALLLPQNPDTSAHTLRRALEKIYGAPIGVVISDTFGRAWRKGQINVAIGLSGIPAIVDLAGQPDAYGRTLAVTQPALADEIAAAAGLLMQKASKTPVVVVRGIDWTDQANTSARDFIRPFEEELFT